MLDLVKTLFDHGYQPLLLRENSKAAAFRNWQSEPKDLDEIAWWLRQGQRFNLSVLLNGSRVCAIDRDSRSRETWEFVRKNKLRSPMEVETPSKGWHTYMRLPEEITDVRSRIRFLGLPIDLLMGARYVVFPPSTIDGKSYEFRKGKG